MTDPAALRRRMVDDLTTGGFLEPGWREAFLAVPRHAFIPDLVWQEQRRDLVPFHRADDPSRWLRLAYASRQVMITQVDDGHPVGPGLIGDCISSSASQPNVVALMLAALGAQPGMRVCEIGTGTGYNAALLAQRLGADHVTSIEVDPEVATRARAALARTGFGAVLVITGDGAHGYPPRAPFDRVLATAAVQRVPYAWVAQTRPGGRVVTPWGTAYLNGALLSLTVGEEGTATGRLVDNVAFMWLRDQRIPLTWVRDCVYDEDNAAVSTTDLHPARVTDDYHAALAIGILVPDCEYRYCQARDDSGEYTVWFLDPNSRSWASLDYLPGADTHEVNQLGPRRLWDEVEAAYRWWVRAGSPTAERWHFTVTPQCQEIYLDQEISLDSPGGAIDLHGGNAPRGGVVLHDASGGAAGKHHPAFEVRAEQLVLAHLDARPVAQADRLITIGHTGIAEEGD
ncbi:MAG: methyltransferase domain-containing protein [Pseudonocardiales bacterium]|nr:methyltransferase domain-containing protein [Pseudonocardiales bacterium]